MLATEKGSHKRLDSATVIACDDLGLVHSIPGGLSVPPANEQSNVDKQFHSVRNEGTLLIQKWEPMLGTLRHRGNRV